MDGIAGGGAAPVSPAQSMLVPAFGQAPPAFARASPCRAEVPHVAACRAADLLVHLAAAEVKSASRLVVARAAASHDLPFLGELVLGGCLAEGRGLAPVVAASAVGALELAEVVAAEVDVAVAAWGVDFASFRTASAPVRTRACDT